LLKENLKLSSESWPLSSKISSKILELILFWLSTIHLGLPFFP
jgi:hypothetical protein